MSEKITVPTELDTQELVDQVIWQLTHEDIFEFVKQLDEQIQEWDFSDKLIAYGRELEAKRKRDDYRVRRKRRPMEVKKTVQREDTIVTDVLCNKCGESLMSYHLNINGVRALMASAFDSPALPDIHLMLTFALCEPCVIALAREFKYPMWDDNEECAWDPDKGYLRDE